MKVEGYFSGIKAANETVSKLKSAGYSGAFADINDHINNAYSQIGVLGSRNISSISEAVLGERNITGDEGSSPLAAASPMVSGMGSFEEIADINCKVIVEVADEDAENVKNIISDMGGTTEDPNPKMPRKLAQIDEDTLMQKNLNP